MSVPVLPDVPWGYAAIAGGSLVTAVGALWRRCSALSDKYEVLLRGTLEKDKEDALDKASLAAVLGAIDAKIDKLAEK